MEQSSGFWRIQRSAHRGAMQLARRQSWPDLPFIHGEIQARMLERSEIMRPAAGCVLDTSLGRLDAALQLAERFDDRQVYLTRWRDPLPQQASTGWLQRQIKRLRSAPAAPQVAGTVVMRDETSSMTGLPATGLVWSNGLLHRIADPAAVLRTWRDALVPGGALFFSCFGPDTARELGAAAKTLGLEFPDFADMHDWGDLLVRSGFSDPVMEMERLVLTYRSVGDLLRDWHALGGNPAVATVPSGAGLRGRGFSETLNKCLQSSSGGGLQITLEILYGHAWRVQRDERPREFSIPVSQIRRKP